MTIAKISLRCILNNEVSRHNKIIQILLAEVYKNLNGVSPTAMLDYKGQHI